MAESILCPEPGVYDGVPFQAYLAWDAASNSRLGHLSRSPAHLRAHLEEPPPETKALKVGRAVHAAVLEPELFAREYRDPTQCAASTSKGAQCSRDGTWPLAGGGAVCTQHSSDADLDPDAVVLTTGEAHTVTGVRDSVLAHPRFRALLAAEGMTEVSVVWDDPATGIRCKARWDRYIPELAGGTVFDLKTTRDASPGRFQRSVFDYGYHRQATLYLMGAKALGLDAAHYAIGAVEKAAPFAPALYRMSEATIGHIPGPGEEAFHAAAHVQALLRLYGECRERDEWPGYPEEVHDISIPEWAWSQMDAQTRDIEEELAA